MSGNHTGLKNGGSACANAASSGPAAVEREHTRGRRWPRRARRPVANRHRSSPRARSSRRGRTNGCRSTPAPRTRRAGRGSASAGHRGRREGRRDGHSPVRPLLRSARSGILSGWHSPSTVGTWAIPTTSSGAHGGSMSCRPSTSRRHRRTPAPHRELVLLAAAHRAPVAAVRRHRGVVPKSLLAPVQAHALAPGACASASTVCGTTARVGGATERRWMSQSSRMVGSCPPLSSSS